jgi:hypothetical protein
MSLETELNSEIVKFWTKSGSSIKRKQIQASQKPLIIHYVVVDKWEVDNLQNYYELVQPQPSTPKIVV